MRALQMRLGIPAHSLPSSSSISSAGDSHLLHSSVTNISPVSIDVTDSMRQYCAPAVPARHTPRYIDTFLYALDNFALGLLHHRCLTGMQLRISLLRAAQHPTATGRILPRAANS